MITLSHELRVWLCAGHTDMRKGFDGLAAMVQHVLHKDPFSGHVFMFRGQRGAGLNCYGGMVRDCVYFTNVWSRGGSCGPPQKPV